MNLNNIILVTIVILVFLIYPLFVWANLPGPVKPEEVKIESEDPPSIKGWGQIVTPLKSIEEKIQEEFPNDKKMLSIGKAESGLIADRASESDLMKDGRPFSFGVFQINITVHHIEDLNCPEAFSGINFNAVVINEELYEKCIQIAYNEDANINKAKWILKTQGYEAWGAYTSNNHKKHEN